MDQRDFLRLAKRELGFTYPALAYIISLRKAEPYETRYYLEAAEDNFGKGN